MALMDKDLVALSLTTENQTLAECRILVLLGAGDDDLAVRRKLGGKPGHLVAVLRSNLSEKDNCTLSNRIVSLSHE